MAIGFVGAFCRSLFGQKHRVSLRLRRMADDLSLARKTRLNVTWEIRPRGARAFFSISAKSRVCVGTLLGAAVVIPAIQF